MAAVADAPDFEQALGDLQDHLPSWLRTRDSTSQLYLLLVALGEQIDELSVLFEQSYLDQVLSTASATGLQRNFAFAWGLQQEQLPTVLPQLRDYIIARTEEDGSLGSLINTLTSLVDTDVNITGGTVLTFPASGGLAFPDPAGGNLVFPVDGTGLPMPAVFGSQPAGLPMYEFPPGSAPSALVGLVFPKDGSGLLFPVNPKVIASDNVIVKDGTLPLGAGPGLIFASNQFVQLTPDFINFRLTVKVQNWMSFDRAAFARAVARFQVADWLPTVIQEITTF